MQIIQNKITVPTNSDPYNLTADLKAAFEQANVVIPIPSQGDRDALVKHDGMAVTRLDLGGLIEVWDADMSAWTRGIQHAEFTGSTSPSPSQSWGTGPLSLDSNASRYGGIFTSPANDRVALPGAGLYSISVRVQMGTAATGTTWVAITNDTASSTYTSYDIQPGASTGAASIPNFYAPAAQNIRIVFYSTTNPGGSGYSLTSRIRVSRIG